MEHQKFRAWDKEIKEMVRVIEFNWFCNSGCTKKTPSNVRTERTVKDEDGEYARTDEFDKISNKFELMQFTGLKDKNGKEIYEGDIIKASYENEDEVGEVFYEKESAMFNIKGSSWFSEEDLLYSDRFYEIIGNIYENPELLEAQKSRSMK